MYQLSQTGTYNNHAISTLGIESFFSSLSKVDFTMTGCPKATQIHKIMPVMMEYNWHKHNPDKIFKMDGRQGAPYHYYNMDKINSSSSDEESDSQQFKSHNFDKYKKKTAKEKNLKYQLVDYMQLKEENNLFVLTTNMIAAN